MGGAATVVCTIASLAKLQAKVNVIGLLPMTENMVSGRAKRPGDVVYASNNKSIQIDNTDAEGRLILADGLCYADRFDPELVCSIATLTGASRIAMGKFSNGNLNFKLTRFLFHLFEKVMWLLVHFQQIINIGIY